MGVFYRIPCISSLIICLFNMARGELYPSIQWSYMNPMFKSNRTQCVYPMSRLFFVCPNTATIVTRLHGTSYLSPQYENLWLVSKQGYERCEVNKLVDRKLIVCDKPLILHYYRVIFKQFSADNVPVFEPGKDYYFIATSDGTQSSTDDISGGHCKTHNMKMKFHICMNSTDPLCQSDELCNGLVPTQAPTTPRITKPTTKTVTTHTVKNKNTSFTNYSIPTTRTSTPAGNPENERNMMLKERTYLITIGLLVFMCVLLLIISAFLIFRSNRNRKAKAPPSSHGSASSRDCPDGDWGNRLLLGAVKLL